LNFASLCFASKQKLLNRSEAKNLKQKKQKKAKKAKALFRFEAKIPQGEAKQKI
jgi:hypothetical protein